MTEEEYKALSLRLLKYMDDLHPQFNQWIVEHEFENGTVLHDLIIFNKALYITGLRVSMRLLTLTQICFGGCLDIMFQIHSLQRT